MLLKDIIKRRNLASNFTVVIIDDKWKYFDTTSVSKSSYLFGVQFDTIAITGLTLVVRSWATRKEMEKLKRGYGY